MPILDINAIPVFRKPIHLHRTKSYAGQKFGKLTVFSLLGMSDDQKHRAVWLFHCDCSNWYYSPINDVLTGRIVSCGCRRFSGDSHRTHGMRRDKNGKTTREYNIWSNMVFRIESITSIQFKDYGGRGIQICEHLRQFEGFFSVLGPSPSNEYSIDRINHNGNYSCGTCDECVKNDWPLNVRWADKWIQAANKRNNRNITASGETYHLAEWSRRRQIDRIKIHNRLKLGWTPEEALEFIPRRASNMSKNP